MRKLITALLLLSLSLPLSGAMTEKEYTAKYAEKLKKLYPTLQISVAGDLELTINDGKAYDAKHWLNNSFAEYRAAPENFDEIVVRYGKAVPQRETKAINPNQIVPVVKDSAWIRETNASIKASSGAEMTDYVKEDICDGLMILYAQDRGDTITYLHEQETKSLKLSSSELRALALKNLQEMLPKIQRHGSDGVYFYSAGGTYEASLILYSWMWDQENFGLPGTPVFAVPTRDVVLATSSENPAGVAKIRAAIEKIYAGKPNYRLTGDLFRVVDGKILPFEKQPDKSVETKATDVPARAKDR